MSTNNFNIQIIEFASPDYDAMVRLRYKILRKPLGLDFTEEQLSLEYSDILIGGYNDDEMCGCLILTPKEDNSIKMRQVAVIEDYQKMGLGKKMVLYSEALAQSRGYDKIVLHARDTAVPFYLNMNYKIEKEPFEEVGIMHQFMEKHLK